MKKYRGKYPFRINQVHSVREQKGIALVVLNNGDKYHIKAIHCMPGIYPEPGEDISMYPFAIKQGEVQNGIQA